MSDSDSLEPNKGVPPSERHDNKPKRRGRPKGSKNKDYEVVLAVPASCIKCGSNEIIKKPNPVTKDGTWKVREDQVGRICFQGKNYRRIRFTKAFCRACGQPIDLREFLEPCD